VGERLGVTIRRAAYGDGNSFFGADRDVAAPGTAGPPPAPDECVDRSSTLRSQYPQVREEAPPYRELHIPIGTPEGVAIAYAARRIVTPRPLTHELFATVLDRFELTLETVRITAVERSSYEAELVVSGPTGVRVIPCRVSDGSVCASPVARPRSRLPTRCSTQLATTRRSGRELSIGDGASFDCGVPFM